MKKENAKTTERIDNSNYSKRLKSQKSPHLAVSFLAFSFLLIFLLAAYLIMKNKGTINGYSIFIIGLILIISFTYLLYKLLSRKINYDIKNMTFQKERKDIKQLIEQDDAEPGSGMLYIPILGDLFSKLWGQKMNKTKRYFIITDENIKTEIDADAYQNLSDQNSCYFVYGKSSNAFVGIEIV